VGTHILDFRYEMTRPAALLFPFAISCCAVLACWPSAGLAQNLGDPVDVALEFQRQENVYFMASRVASFTPATGRGSIQWDRYVRQPGLSFNKVDANFARSQSAEFPGTEYDRDPTLPFAIDFVSPRTIRLRFSTRDVPIDARPDSTSIMLAGPVSTDRSWTVSSTDSTVTYASRFGRVRLSKSPWAIELFDSAGTLLTRTQRLGQPASFAAYVPFSFVRRSRDMARNTAATFELSADEKIFGFGESFTRLNKRGQRIVAYLRDAMGR
jgi:alpha-D-xyloside xylohydrolase